jgi:hypothetical protein
MSNNQNCRGIISIVWEVIFRLLKNNYEDYNITNNLNIITAEINNKNKTVEFFVESNDPIECRTMNVSKGAYLPITEIWK